MQAKQISMTMPELGLVAATRAAIGVGAGLLLSNTLSRDTRKAIGLPLLIFGALSTIPIAIHVFHQKDNGKSEAGETSNEPQPTLH